MNEPVAWLALAVSIVAAFFAWRTSVEARRQADAVIGDVPPTISLFQPKREHNGGFAVVELEIVNHNRLPIYIERWQFDFPEGMRIYQAHDNERQTLGAIFDAVMHQTRNFALDLSVRIPGSSAREPAPFERAIFNITDENSKGPVEPIDVSATVCYRVDGDDQAREEKRSITWRPLPKKF